MSEMNTDKSCSKCLHREVCPAYLEVRIFVDKDRKYYIADRNVEAFAIAQAYMCNQFLSSSND